LSYLLYLVGESSKLNYNRKYPDGAICKTIRERVCLLLGRSCFDRVEKEIRHHYLPML
jgi:hypothetical protein